MSVLVEKMNPIQIHRQDAGRLDRRRAAAVDIKEGRAEHGKGADQTCSGGSKGNSGIRGDILMKDKLLVLFLIKPKHHPKKTKHEFTSWIFFLRKSFTCSYRGTAPEPGEGSTAAPAACAGWSYSATSGSPVCCKTARGRTPACRV